MKVRYTSQKYKSNPNGDRLRALSVCRSIGIGCAMISLKNFSPSSIVLSHNEGAFGSRADHQNLGAFRDERTHHNLVITFGVDQLDRAGKEPLHLILKTGAFAVASPAAIFHAELVHELIEESGRAPARAAASSRLPSTPTLRAGAGCCRRAAAPASRRP